MQKKTQNSTPKNTDLSPAKTDLYTSKDGYVAAKTEQYAKKQGSLHQQRRISTPAKTDLSPAKTDLYTSKDGSVAGKNGFSTAKIHRSVSQGTRTSPTINTDEYVKTTDKLRKIPRISPPGNV